MTLLIGGAPTGLLDSSQTLLGRNDQTSTATTDNGDALFVNVASGNLLYAHQDAYMASRGEDYTLLRTYNSRGSSTAGGAFNDARWDVSTTVTLRVIGTGPDTRYEVRYGEGSVFEYALNAATGTYISTDGAGAYETLEVLRDGAGAVLGYTVVRADQARLSFDAQGRLTRWEDPSGVFQSFAYGAFGVTQVTDDEGHTLGYAYNTNGRLISVTDERGVVLVRYAYSGGRLASVTDRRGHVTRYFYYPDGYLQRVELPSTQVVGGVGQSFAARVISFEYQTLTGPGVPPAGTRLLSRMVDAEGNASSFSYAFTLNAQGERTGAGTTTLTDALGKTMRYSYRADGAITSVVDPSGRATTYGYDAAGNLLSVADRNAAGVAVSDLAYYRALRAQLGYTDATGAGKRAADLTVAEKTALKALFTTRYSYDARGNLRTSTDNAGNTTTYTYTAFNKIATITTAEGGVTRFSYDAKQNLIKQVDPGGDVTRFTYDVYGNLLSRVVYLDRADAQKAPSNVAEDKKQVTRFFYDLYGNNTRTIDAEGHSTYATYDRFGNMLTSTDARGNKTRYTYDGDSRLVQLQDAAGRKTIFAYDAVGNRIGLTTDWDGRTITQVFDRNNRLISTIDSAPEATAPRTTTVGYDEVGNRTSVTDAEGRRTTYTYNARRELVEITSAGVDHDGDAATAALQYTRTLAYDFEGNLITETDARGNVTAWQYTRDGLLRLQTTADGQVTQYSYDKNQNLLSVVAGLQLEVSRRQTTSYAYDAENQLFRVTDAKGNVTAYAYDAPGNMIEMTDAEGRVSRMSYDRNNRLRFEVSAAVGVFDAVTGAAVIDEGTGLQQTVSYTVEHRFDANGNEIETIDQNGQSTRYAFDAVDRTSSMTDANGITTGYTYDDNDNILGITITAAGAASPSEVSSYRYDEFDQLISATDGVGNALATSDAPMYQTLRKELGYTVTEGDVTRGKLVAELTDADKTALLAAFTTRYSYDNVGNRTSESEPGQASGKIAHAEYDALDRVSATLSADGVQTRFEYDGAGNLIAQRDYALRYVLDANGRIPAPKAEDAPRVVLGGFDALGRTESTQIVGGTSQTRGYDAFGNLDTLGVGRAEEAVSGTIAYDALNRVISTTDARGVETVLVLDARGNILEKTENAGALLDAPARTTRYTYDALDRLLTEVSPLGTLRRYQYDGEGNLVRLEVTDPLDLQHPRVQRFEYDDGGRLKASIDAMTVRTEYTYDALGNTTRIEYAVGREDAYTEYFEFDASGRMLARVDGENQRTEYRYDAGGDLVRLTEAAGTASERVTAYRYDAAGQLTEQTEAPGTTLERSTRFYYDGKGNRIATLQPEQRVTWSRYDADSRLVSETVGRGEVVVAADGSVNVTMLSEHGGIRTDSTYDSRGNLVQQSEGFADAFDDPQTLQTTRFTYDSLDRLQRVTDPEGFSTITTHDAYGNVLSITRGAYLPQPGDAGYDAAKANVAERRTESLRYDLEGRLIQRVDAEGSISVYAYNGFDDLGVSASGLSDVGLPPNPLETSYQYDANGKVLEERTNLGGITRYTRDSFGRETQVEVLQSVAADGRQTWSTTVYAYDHAGRLVLESLIAGVPDPLAGPLSEDPGDSTTRYYYDAIGNQVEVRDGCPAQELRDAPSAQARRTLFEYDALGRLSSQTDAQSNRRQFAYDANDNLVRLQSARGSIQRLFYDEYDRVVGDLAPDGSYIGYTLDAAGSRVSTREYATRVVAAQDAVTGPPPEDATRDRLTVRVFDKNNLLTGQTLPTGRQMLFEYDGSGQLLKQTERVSASTEGWALTADTSDRVTTWDYDLAGRLVSYVNAEGAREEYAYDAAGNQTLERIVPKAGLLATGVADPMRETWSVYDPLGRVTSVSTGSNIQRIEYDLAGNAVKRTDARGNETEFRYDSRNQVVSETDANQGLTGYGIDLFGNVVLTSRYGGGEYRKTAVYTYDHNDRVVAETADAVDWYNSAGSAGYGAGVTAYEYDADGNLVAITDENGFRSLRAYDASGRVITEIDGAGFVRTYTYNAFGEVEQTRVYNTPVTINGATTAAQVDSAIAALANNSNYTIVTSAYDRSGNVVSTQYPPVLVTRMKTAEELRIALGLATAPNTASTHTTSADGLTWVWDGVLWVSIAEQLPQETVDHNAWGEAVRSTNVSGDVAYAWFDKLGRLTAAVNGGYLISTDYDCQDNVVRQVNHGSKLSGALLDIAKPRPSPTLTTIDVVVTRRYDGNNNLISEKTGWIQTLSGAAQPETLYEYDVAGNMTRRSSTGFDEYYYYDRLNRLAGVFDARSLVFTRIQYNAFGQVTERRRFWNQTTLAVVASAASGDFASGPVSVNDSDQVSRSTYNNRGWLLRETTLGATGNDRDSWSAITIAYRYDLAGQRTEVTEGDLNEAGTTRAGGTSYSTRTVYDARGLQSAERAANGLWTWYERNGSGQITRQWSGAQGTTFETAKVYTWNLYNAAGTLVASNAGDGQWREFDVDAYGNRLRTTNYGIRGANETLAAFKARSLGGVYKALIQWDTETYAQFLARQEATGYATIVTHTRFDARGFATESWDALGARTKRDYDFAGRVVREFRPGYIAQNATNTFSDLVLEYAFDGAGNLTREMDARFTFVNHFYDLAGNRVQTTYPLGNSQVRTYNNRGLLSAEKWTDSSGSDVAGSTTLYGYDQFGRVTSMDRGLGQVTTIAYDSLDRIVSVTNAGATTSSADNEITRYWYDSRGNNTWTQDGNGNFFGRDYDAAGNITAQYSFSGIYEYAGAAIDAAALNLTLATARSAALNPVAWESDSSVSWFNPVPQEAANESPIPGGIANALYLQAGAAVLAILKKRVLASRAEFDLYGNRTADIDPNSSRTTYSYGIFSQQTRVEKGSSVTPDIVYDKFGRKILESARTILGNTSGVTTTDYDAAGRILASQVVDTYTNLTGQPVTDARTTRYTYYLTGDCKEERLYAKTVMNGVDYGQFLPVVRHQQYAYDPDGNLLTATDLVATGLTPSTTRFEYDANGRKTLSETRRILLGGAVDTRTASYTFDAANRVLTETRDWNVGLGPVRMQTFTFTYDAAGRRASQRLQETYSFPATADNPSGFSVPVNHLSVYTYQTNGRIAQSRKEIGAFKVVEDVWRYDKAGNEIAHYSNPLSQGELAWLQSGLIYCARFSDEGRTYDADKTDAEIGLDAFSRVALSQTTYDASNRVVATANVDRLASESLFGANTYVQTDYTGALGNVSSSDYQNAVWIYNQIALDRGGRTTFSRNIERRVDYSLLGNWYQKLTSTDYAYGYSSGSSAVLQVLGIKYTGYGPDRDEVNRGNTFAIYDVSGKTREMNRGQADADTPASWSFFRYDTDGNIIHKLSRDDGVAFYRFAMGQFLGEGYAATTSFISYFAAVGDDSSGDFSETVQEIGTDLPTSTTWVTSQGASLRDLAAQYYGSPDLWYVIAEANGFSSNTAPPAGMRLAIPGTVENAFHTSSTHRLYNPSEIIGTNLPNILPEDQSCKLIVAIILIVVIAIVAVIATIFTAGAAAPAVVGGTVTLSSALLATASAVAIGAGIAFAASVMTQLVLVGFGLQKKFDWGEVAGETLTGAIGALTGGVLDKFAKVASVANKLRQLSSTARTVLKVARATAYVALEVAGEIASQSLSNKGRIDWGLVAVSGVAAGLGDIAGGIKRGQKAAILDKIGSDARSAVAGQDIVQSIKNGATRRKAAAILGIDTGAPLPGGNGIFKAAGSTSRPRSDAIFSATGSASRPRSNAIVSASQQRLSQRVKNSVASTALSAARSAARSAATSTTKAGIAARNFGNVGVESLKYGVASLGLKRTVVAGRFSPVRLLFRNTAIDEITKQGELIKIAKKTLKAERGKFFSTLDNLVVGPAGSALVKGAPKVYKTKDRIVETIANYEQYLQRGE